MANASAHLIDTLSGISLFADVAAAELNSIAHDVDERRFADGERIIRQGITGSAFYLILEGEASIRLDGKDYGTLARGDFFGEISCLLGVPPVSDIVAQRALRCLVLPASKLEDFLVANPRVMFRLLQGEARKLRSTTLWQS
jgi:CRP-like cAMP-binding protein